MGAFRRASHQMKNEIPPISSSAPAAIPAIPAPLRPLLPELELDDAVVVELVVVVGAPWGRPGLNGLVELGRPTVPLLPAATATAGPAAATRKVSRTSE